MQIKPNKKRQISQMKNSNMQKYCKKTKKTNPKYIKTKTAIFAYNLHCIFGDI